LQFQSFDLYYNLKIEYLLVFVTVKNLVGIGAVVSIIWSFKCFASLVWKCLFMLIFGWFWGIWPPRWDTISIKLPKVKSKGHYGSSGVLIMLVPV